MRKPDGPLRTGFTTGTCATAGAAASAGRLLNGEWSEGKVMVALPKGQKAWFDIVHPLTGEGWAECGVVKDAGDDPDVTHGALIKSKVEFGQAGSGIQFRAGEGVGTVTKDGLPIAVGEPAINPVPRQMIAGAVAEVAAAKGVPPDFVVTVSIPGGAEIAQKTWNPRLGIVGGLSILGTTGIVRPFSCSSWIASIHRGIDVARADGLRHVCGSTGNMSERAAQAHFGLPDHAMLDMGDFAGGMLKYLARNPVERITIAGGFGKLTKLAQGAVDLHSARSVVDFDVLADWAKEIGADGAKVRQANTAKEALDRCGPELAAVVAGHAKTHAERILNRQGTVDILIVDREGNIIAQT